MKVKKSMHEIPIQAVTFDVGGTLIEPWPSVGHIYASVAERHGWPGLSVETLDRQFAGAWRALENFRYTREEWAALVDATFQGLVGTPPSRTFFPELYECFAEAEAWRVFEDVVPVLKALRARKLKLGVISNWDERLLPLLRRLKLHDYFDAVTVSCDVGFAKPSPVIFERAARELALPPGAILHVGDSAAMDVAGARGAGLRATRLQRGAAAAATRPDSPAVSLSPPERGARPAGSSRVVPFEGWGEGNRACKPLTSSPPPSPPFGEEREKMAAVPGCAPIATELDEIKSLYALEEILQSSKSG
jgi:putative hydrolase of the HAD superfamily